jgi:hypothetical protein
MLVNIHTRRWADALITAYRAQPDSSSKENESVRTIIAVLVGRGWCREYVIGAIANALKESRLNPDVVVADPTRRDPLAVSIGLFQLNTGPTGLARPIVDSHGLTRAIAILKDPAANVSVIAATAEARLSPEIRSGVKPDGSPVTCEWATYQFCLQVERPAGGAVSATERARTYLPRVLRTLEKVLRTPIS